MTSVLLRNNRDKEAIVSFNKSDQLNPTNSKTLFFLAINQTKWLLRLIPISFIMNLRNTIPRYC